MSIKVKEVIWERKYKKWGFVLRKEIWETELNPPIPITYAYTPSGEAIGTSRWAWILCVKRGIAPQKRHPDHSVCSIGFSERENKWYGWSHRAIYGFTVGDVVSEGDCTAEEGWSEEWLEEHPEDAVALPVGFVAKTMDDAKRMAIAFAACVS